MIKILLLVLFFSTMIIVGIYSRKHATNVNDFVLGGRDVGPWLTAFAYGTSYFSAVVFVGYAGQFGWKYGLSATWIGLGNAFIGSFLAWKVLGKKTRIMTHHLNVKTMPDFFSKRYDSKKIKIAASAITFIFLIPYTSSVYNGLSRLFGMAFNIPYWACVVGMALLTCIYVTMGGYMATAINDLIQGIIMIFGIIMVILAVVNGQGGFSEAIKSLSSIPSDLPTSIGETGLFTYVFGPEPLNLLCVVILTSLGTWGLPQMVHKFYAIKDDKAIKIGTTVSTVFAIIVSGGCYLLGGFGRLFDSPILYNGSKIMYDAIMPYMLSSLSEFLIGVIVILVLSASMSTLSALVLTSSSTLTLDFIKDTLFKDMSEKTQIMVMRLLIIFFIILSVVLALDPTVFIAQLMSISWGALAGAFLAPFIYGLYWKGVTKAAVWSSFAIGIGITVSNLIFKYIASPINAGAISLITSLIIVPIISMITPKISSEKLDDVFECFEE